MHQEDFQARFAKIQREIVRMLERDAPVGNLWANPTYWMNALFKHDASWVATNFRWVVGDALSDGYPRQYDDPPEELARIGARYDRFSEGLPESMRLEEPAFARPWGFDWKGRRMTHATVRMQRCVANLYRHGVFREAPMTVLEIGAGHGLLAYHLLARLAHGSRYIIIDIPPILALSATMLAVQRPDLRQGFSPDSDADIVLLPHYIMPTEKIDLALNTASFQEMTEENVDNYGALLARLLEGVLFTENMRRHPWNYSMRNKIPTILGRHLSLYPDDAVYDPLEKRAYIWQHYIHFASRVPPKPSPIIGENFTFDGELHF